MPDGFKVEVPITVKGGREGEKVGKQIGEKIAEQLKKAFRGVGITRPAAGGGGAGVGTEAMAAAGMGKSLKGIAGKAGIIALAVTATVGILSKFSPQLKGVLSIFGRAFSLFFRPFGDFLATLLRPLAIMLMKMAVAFLKWTRTPGVTKAKKVIEESIGLQGGLIGPGPGLPTMAMLGPIIDWIKGLDFSKVKEFPAWVWSKLTALDFRKLKEFSEWTWGKLTGGLSNVWNILSGWADWVWQKITWPLSNLGSTLMMFAGWVWDQVTGSLSNVYTILQHFGSWIYSTIQEPLKNTYWFLIGIGGWIYHQIIDPLSNIKNWLSGIGMFLYHRITESIISAFKGFTFGWSWFWRKGQVGIPVVPETGPYILHKGEEVVPRTKAGQNRSVIFRPTFQINAGITRDIDVDAIVRRAGRMTELDLKRRGII